MIIDNTVFDVARCLQVMLERDALQWLAHPQPASIGRYDRGGRYTLEHCIE
ncbi:hypothetical protein [Rhizobium sp. BK418]|uniref:hypothetical protein n=1 Tax=Rhizobium sp. BK418 TaxID=2512120 RepID=UPI001FDF6C87|nr:hypothetical protein [Rhizobium sp. BK418]